MGRVFHGLVGSSRLLVRSVLPLVQQAKEPRPASQSQATMEPRSSYPVTCSGSWQVGCAFTSL